MINFLNLTKMQIYNFKVRSYTARTEVIDNISYKVVPVVMMKEGVHHGSHGVS